MIDAFLLLIKAIIAEADLSHLVLIFVVFGMAWLWKLERNEKAGWVNRYLEDSKEFAGVVHGVTRALELQNERLRK